jgi:acetyl-CoA carboxylase biotin carboxyl carrier protein
VRRRSTIESQFMETGMTGNTGSNPGDVFDVKKVRKFIELMNEHELAEIDLKQGDQRIRLRRGPEIVTVGSSPAISGGSFAPSSATAAGSSSGAKGGESATDESKALLIRCPMIGTFYAAANPESPPFVKVGDRVGPDTTVCIVEAMKVFNEIPAECSGRIVAVLAQSGEPVEFNQPLFRLEPN